MLIVAFFSSVTSQSLQQKMAPSGCKCIKLWLLILRACQGGQVQVNEAECVLGAQGFVRQPSRDIVLQSRDPKQLIDQLETYSPPASIIKLALEGKLLHNLRG